MADRHQSYIEKIVNGSGVVEKIPYCLKDGVPWPCEVEQRDRMIEVLTDELAQANATVRSIAGELSALATRAEARRG